MTEKVAATVLMSGGIDSAACTHFLIAQGFAVDGLFVDHGHAAHILEVRAAIAMSEYLGVPFRELTVSGLETFGAGEIAGRNAFLIFAALLATRGRPGLLALGLHGGTPYYDCSEAFVDAAAKLVVEQTDGHVSVVVPFLSWTKKDVHSYFHSAGLPISHTYSCEAGTQPVCGECASCRDRKALEC